MNITQRGPLGQKTGKAKPNPEHMAKVAKLPTPDELSALALYDSETGVVSWLARTGCRTGRKGEVRRWNACFAGKALGTVSNYGYLVACIFGRQFKVHRIAYALHHGAWPKGQIDHINGDRKDNRICNLREVTPRQNALNRKLLTSNSSGTCGVCETKYGTFVAYISTGDERLNLGSFGTKEEAVIARKTAEIRLNYHENHGRAS